MSAQLTCSSLGFAQLHCTCSCGLAPHHFSSRPRSPLAALTPADSPSPARSGDGGEPFAASCAALTEQFILLGLLDGTLAFYGADDCQLVSEYEHSQGIVAAYPDAEGTL